MIVLLALLAAFVFGGGVALQQRAAVEVPEGYAAKPALLARLLRDPIWLAGLAADFGGFVLLAAALHRGSLVVVQPLVTTSLLFTLGLTAAWTRAPISLTEWAAVVLVLAGLAGFLVVASPDEQGAAIVDTDGWLLCAVVVAAVIAVAVVAGLRASGPMRAGLLALGAGTADAFMAVLTKAFSGSFSHGITSVFTSWTPYAVAVMGVIAILLVSTAYQAGYPTVSLPIITVTDPLIGSLIGVTLFAEHVRLNGARGPLVACALLAMVAGLVMLTRDERITSAVARDAPDTRATEST
ncbi:MAG TPA: DMT family transporter [Acidimicrobiales bacterium]|nr:DMT family transporter [Acidimicrobiales bacterium]